MLIAIAVTSPLHLASGVVSLVAATLFTWVFVSRRSVQDGIYGYNALLFGLMLCTFHYPLTSMPWLLVVSAIGGVLCSLVTLAMGQLLVPSFDLPPLTFPFQLVGFMWMLAASDQQLQYFPIDGNLLASSIIQNPTSFGASVAAVSFNQIIFGALHGVSQVMFLESIASSCLIIAGLAFCSPISACMALTGSFFAALFAAALGVNGELIFSGLWSFNSCLSAIALGGLYFIFRGTKSFVYTVICVFMTVLTSGDSFLLLPSHTYFAVHYMHVVIYISRPIGSWPLLRQIGCNVHSRRPSTAS